MNYFIYIFTPKIICLQPDETLNLNVWAMLELSSIQLLGMNATCKLRWTWNSSRMKIKCCGFDRGWVLILVHMIHMTEGLNPQYGCMGRRCYALLYIPGVLELITALPHSCKFLDCRHTFTAATLNVIIIINPAVSDTCPLLYSNGLMSKQKAVNRKYFALTLCLHKMNMTWHFASMFDIKYS